MNATERMEFRFGPFGSAVVVGDRVPSLDGLLAAAYGEAEAGKAAVLVVCDEGTRHLAEPLASGGKANAGKRAPLCVLQAGEESKGWASSEKVLRAAIDGDLARDGVFVGVGGGVVCDLVAFAASVYMRGARLVLVPTTLLAMVDAAIGGKTGFDLGGYKNLVGTFRPADLVYAATGALETLPEREWRSGLAEVLKTAVIGDVELLKLLEERRDAILAGPDAAAGAGVLTELVRRCAAVKGRIVQADPTETGAERPLLNLGHTFGHALESVAGLGRLTHGEAVAWGMGRACALAELLAASGGLPYDSAWIRRIRRLLSDYGYETAPLHPAASAAAQGDEEAAIAALVSAMGKDKKKKAGVLRFVVPSTEPSSAAAEGTYGATLAIVDPETAGRALRP